MKIQPPASRRQRFEGVMSVAEENRAVLSGLFSVAVVVVPFPPFRANSRGFGCVPSLHTDVADRQEQEVNPAANETTFSFSKLRGSGVGVCGGALLQGDTRGNSGRDDRSKE